MGVFRLTHLTWISLITALALSATGCSRVSLINPGRRQSTGLTLTNSNYRVTAGGGVVTAPGISAYTAVGEEFSPTVQTGSGVRVILNTSGAVPTD